MEEVYQRTNYLPKQIKINKITSGSKMSTETSHYTYTDSIDGQPKNTIANTYLCSPTFHDFLGHSAYTSDFFLNIIKPQLVLFSATAPHYRSTVENTL